MKKKQLACVCLSLILAVVLATPAFAKDTQKSKQDSPRQVKAGKEFVITLNSNMTTGYQWQLAKAVDKGYLVLLGLKYVARQTKLVGAGGKEEWTFKAIKPGSTAVSFQYVRPWEKKAPAKIKTIKVVIK